MARPTVQLGCQEGETGRSHWTAARHFASDARPGRVRFSCKSGTTEFANPTRTAGRRTCVGRVQAGAFPQAASVEHSLRVVLLLHAPHALEVAAPVSAVLVGQVRIGEVRV